ncbi:MAG: alpha-hydroxy-acid oxidizing protein, partial [Saprospiraceae bacterium]|nr:alpha-hydroxy-acid oxidizing protein [Saprospiraceae bacterium]
MTYDRYREKWMNQYPTIHDLELMAEKRIPKVASAYMQTGTSHEALLKRNMNDLQDIHITPRFAKGELSVDLSTSLFGQKYSAPFGTAPIGLMGLIWPRAEMIVTEMAKSYNIPAGLSTVATETPEMVGPYAGDMGWFQLYTPRDP